MEQPALHERGMKISMQAPALLLLPIVLVLGYHLSQDPMVNLLGLAHSRIAVGPAELPVLIVDHLSTADAPIIAGIFQGEVWGRHRAQTLGIWLPMLALALSFAALIGLLTHAQPRAPQSPVSLPSPLLGVPLFLGACVGATTDLAPFTALLPWLFCAVGLLVAANRRPRGASALSCTRWFWLGFLLLSPAGFFNTETASSTTPRLLELTVSLILVVLIFVTANSSKQDRLTRTELWILLPCLAIAMAVGSLQTGLLPVYFLVSLTSAQLTVWLEDRGSSRPLITACLSGALATLVLCAGGLPQWQVALLSGGEEPEFRQAKRDLQEKFSGQVRLANLDGIPLLVGCNIDVALQSDALGVVTRYLGETPQGVSVRSRRWERGARIVLSVTVTAFLVVSTLLLTLANPRRRSGVLRHTCLLLAGANLAFAFGAALGWFWLEPTRYLAGAALAAFLAWMSYGHPRAWVEAWIAQNIQSRRSLTSGC